MKKGWPSPYDKLTTKKRREKEVSRYLHVSNPLVGTDHMGCNVYDFARGHGITLKLGRNKAKTILKGAIL